METKVVISEKFTLAWRDVLRGAILAAITSALVIVQETIDKGILNFNWKVIGMAAVGAFVGYLLKNLLIEPSKVITTLPSSTDAQQVKDNIKQVL